VVPIAGVKFNYKLTLSRVVSGKWQGPLDAVADNPQYSYKAQATLQTTAPGKVRLTYSHPKDGPQTADGTYANSRITFGTAPQSITYSRQ
jgi:hypothetical protein